MLPRARLYLGLKAIPLSRDRRIDVVEGVLDPFGPEVPYVEEEVADTVVVLVLVEDEEFDVWRERREREERET